jgi:hypothetical protein
MKMLKILLAAGVLTVLSYAYATCYSDATVICSSECPATYSWCYYQGGFVTGTLVAGYRIQATTVGSGGHTDFKTDSRYCSCVYQWYDPNLGQWVSGTCVNYPKTVTVEDMSKPSC